MGSKLANQSVSSPDCDIMQASQQQYLLSSALCFAAQVQVEMRELRQNITRLLEDSGEQVLPPWTATT